MEGGWSDEFYRLLGISPGDCASTFEGFLQFVHPADREFMEKWYLGLTRKPGRDTLDFRIIRPDGRIRTLFSQIRVFSDESGTPVRTIGTVLNITALKTATEKAAQAETRFEGILRAAPNPILGVDSRGRIIFANDQTEKAFGYQTGELQGKSLEILVPDTFNKVHQGHREKYTAHPHVREMGKNLSLLGQRDHFSVENQPRSFACRGGNNNRRRCSGHDRAPRTGGAAASSPEDGIDWNSCRRSRP